MERSSRRARAASTARGKFKRGECRRVSKVKAIFCNCSELRREYNWRRDRTTAHQDILAVERSPGATSLFRFVT